MLRDEVSVSGRKRSVNLRLFGHGNHFQMPPYFSATEPIFQRTSIKNKTSTSIKLQRFDWRS